MFISTITFAACLVFLYSFIACSSSDSYTDIALLDNAFTSSSENQCTGQIVELSQSESCSPSLSFDLIRKSIDYLDLEDIFMLRLVYHYFCQERYTNLAVEKLYKEVDMSVHERRKADLQIKLKGCTNFMYCYSTRSNLHKLSMALGNGIVERLHFMSFSEYADFENKFLLKQVFVQLEKGHPCSKFFSNTDFKFVDKICITTGKTRSSSWLQNESFVNTKWKNIVINMSALPLSLEDHSKLISNLKFEQLVISAELIPDVRWPEIFASLNEDIRKKIHLERCVFILEFPNVVSIRSTVGYPRRFSIGTMKSSGLLRFIKERSLLNELELDFFALSDFESFKGVVEEADLARLDRELKIILKCPNYRKTKTAEFIFSSLK